MKTKDINFVLILLLVISVIVIVLLVFQTNSKQESPYKITIEQMRDKIREARAEGYSDAQINNLVKQYGYTSVDEVDNSTTPNDQLSQCLTNADKIAGTLTDTKTLDEAKFVIDVRDKERNECYKRYSN